MAVYGCFRMDVASHDCKDDDEKTRTKIREELSDLTFEELQLLKEEIGTKILNKALFGTNKATSSRQVSRRDKNSPLEVSSKHPPKMKSSTFVPKQLRRDPRFDDLSGTFNERIFRSTYGFIGKMKEREKMAVAKQLRKTKNPKETVKLKALIQKMESEEQRERLKLKEEEERHTWRAEQAERIKEGKNPRYVNKSEKRLQTLAEKYDKLKATGMLEKYLMKARRKNATKEKLKLPQQ